MCGAISVVYDKARVKRVEVLGGDGLDIAKGVDEEEEAVSQGSGTGSLDCNVIQDTTVSEKFTHVSTITTMLTIPGRGRFTGCHVVLWPLILRRSCTVFHNRVRFVV